MVDSGSMSRNSRLEPEPHTGCPIHYLLKHCALTLLIFKMEENSGGKRAGKTTEVPNSPNIDFSIACHVKANLINFKIRNSICVTLQFTAKLLVCYL